MSMTPERVAERVAGLIESILNSSSECFSKHNAHESLFYIAQVHELGIINDAQSLELESAIQQALQDWLMQPQRGLSDERDVDGGPA